MQSGLIIRVQSREVPGSFKFDEKAKQILHLDIDDYDDALRDWVVRAIDDVERFTGQAIGKQTRRMSWSILTETILLPYGPVISVTDIDAGGSVDEDGRLTANWPTGGKLTVECGYTDYDSLPGALATAVVLAIVEYSGLDRTVKPGSWKESARRARRFNWAS